MTEPMTPHERPDDLPLKPKRIQRKRTRGWRMPEGAVYVGRPSFWANPFRVCDGWPASRCVAEFRRIALNRSPQFTERTRQELRGKDLACWCPLVDKDGQPVPCHADVLLEIANS